MAIHHGRRANPTRSSRSSSETPAQDVDVVLVIAGADGEQIQLAMLARVTIRQGRGAPAGNLLPAGPAGVVQDVDVVLVIASADGEQIQLAIIARGTIRQGRGASAGNL